MSKIRINHSPGKTDAEVFIRNATTFGSQFLMGGQYDPSLTLKLDADDIELLKGLLESFASVHAEEHSSLTAGYNPVSVEHNTLRLKWRDRGELHVTDGEGSPLKKTPALFDGGEISIAFGIWTSVYEKEGDTRVGVNFRPKVIRVHNAGDGDARVRDDFDAWMLESADEVVADDQDF